MGNIIGEPFSAYVKNQIDIRQQKIGSLKRDDPTLIAYNAKAPYLRLISSVNINNAARLPRDETEEANMTMGVGFIDNKGTVLESLENLGFDPLFFKGNQLAAASILMGGTLYYKPLDRDDSGNQIEDTSQLSLNHGLNNFSTPQSPSEYAVGSTGPQIALTNGAYGWGNTSSNKTTGRGYVPMPGITDAQVQYYNNGALSEATINIKCFSKEQFAIIDALYLRPGYTLLLEFGHSVFLNSSGEAVRPGTNLSLPARTVLQGSSNHFDLYTQLEAQRESYSANYDGVYGKVSKFNWSFEKDGSYNCKVTIIGLGSIIESLRINAGPVDKSGYSFGALGEDILKRTKRSLLHAFLYSLIDEAKEKENVIEEEQATLAEEAATEAYVESRPTLYTDKFDAAGVQITESRIARRETQAELQKVRITTTADAVIRDTDRNFDGTRGTTTIPESILFINNVKGDAVNSESAALAKGAQVYVKLGVIISFIQNKMLLYNESSVPIFKFDMNSGASDEPLQEDENYILNIPGQFSCDPLVCLVPYTNTADVSTSYSSTGFPRLGNSELNITINEKFSDLGFFLGNNSYAARLANILVNVDFAFNSLDNFTSQEDGTIAILDYVKNLLSNISRALGGINNIEIQSTDNGLIKFIDKIPPQYGIGGSSEYTTIKAFSRNATGGSFVRDIRLNSELSPEFASMVTIGAQANGNSVAANATSFSLYNRGLYDRVLGNKLSEVNGIDETAEVTLQSLYNDFINSGRIIYNKIRFNNEAIQTLSQAGARFIQFMLGELTNSGNVTSPFFLPFNLSLTLDGISGVKLYQKFKISDNVLPPSYSTDRVDLIVKSVNHQITTAGWTTEIETLSAPSSVGGGNGVLNRAPARPFLNPELEVRGSGDGESFDLSNQDDLNLAFDQNIGSILTVKNLVAKYESNGNYNVYNYGRDSRNNIGAKASTNASIAVPSIGTTQITTLTFNQVRNNFQSILPNEPFACGKYQIVPNTMDGVIDFLGGDLLFDETGQEKAGDYLFLNKRGEVGAYLRGNNSGNVEDLEAAVQGIGQEFASMPCIVKANGEIAGDVINGSGKAGYYDGVGVNGAAKVTVGNMVCALIQSRMDKSTSYPAFVPDYYTEEFVRQRDGDS